jgi:anhydro-N-acetylmuramic acid kinase
MSGTSLDGLDACLAAYHNDGTLEVLDTDSRALPESVRVRFEQMVAPGASIQLAELLEAEIEYTAAVSAQCHTLIQRAPGQIDCIGFHGQTLWHAPEVGNTFQIGMAERLAHDTGIPVAHQFRRGDMARGGQGAPLAPLFHQAQFARDAEGVAILNLGGIANLTELIPGQPTRGYDLGPANTLSDLWYRQHHAGSFDQDGAWARSGTVDETLLSRMKADPFFAKSPPKSTGRDYFNLDWLKAHLTHQADLQPEDVQATLNQLTVDVIADALTPDIDILVVAGGGVHNHTLMDQLDDQIDPLVVTSETFAIDPDFLEAAGFAWFGVKCLDRHVFDTSTITGARGSGILGTLVYPE